MTQVTAKFNAAQGSDFNKTLNQRVNSYFKENGITRFGNSEMYFKVAFIIVLYFTPLALFLSGSVSSVWVMALCWFLMGLGMTGIGLCIMHDANHGSISNKKSVNSILGYLLNLVGGYHICWKIQHNVLHHTYTNVHNHDEDIDNKFMRFSPNQEHKNIHRLQHIYAPFLYSLLTLFWLFAKDFIQINEYSKLGLLEKQGKTKARALTEAISLKVAYVAVTLGVVYYVNDFPFWMMLVGFITMHLITGTILAYIFQPAHVQQDMEFVKLEDDNQMVDNCWAVHQLRTTGNFANSKKLFSWCIGGLNYQIEHHLFPNICHVHYKKLSPIVKQTAEEFGITYHHQETFIGAVIKHSRLLKKLGKNLV